MNEFEGKSERASLSLRLFHLRAFFLEGLSNLPTRSLKMLASWAMASLVVLHVYSLLIVQPLAASQMVQEIIQAMRKITEYFECESLLYFLRLQHTYHFVFRVDRLSAQLSGPPGPSPPRCSCIPNLVNVQRRNEPRCPL